MTEVWKDIKGYEGYYEVSDLGRVRSLERMVSARGCKNREHNRVIPCIADSRADGFSPVCINYCCHGKIRQHKGFAWEYENP